MFRVNSVSARGEEEEERETSRTDVVQLSSVLAPQYTPHRRSEHKLCAQLPKTGSSAPVFIKKKEKARTDCELVLLAKYLLDVAARENDFSTVDPLAGCTVSRQLSEANLRHGPDRLPTRPPAHGRWYVIFYLT